ncbi:hypothetical protein JOF42_000821 [Microbacterium phyllosphaerae]|uniref:Uncharacterized protein n=1 Tax=Microbacterium phyllosphaerae TaxID=124798 RepID=A0ABS4WMA7_9MICO|nr:hypothetical protein [Microbacterium phyllosphaerae]MBP2377326.1 hypothetical protein [Microbacterium phyllosphaerae]MCS3442787.1 hypothetical protein [Microbacterium phyllosphaerae]
MVERFTLEDAGYIAYTDMLDRLRARFPSVPAWRLDQIVTAEHDAITGGILQIVPAEVESGAAEMLSREADEREQQDSLSDDGEVA